MSGRDSRGSGVWSGDNDLSVDVSDLGLDQSNQGQSEQVLAGLSSLTLGGDSGGGDVSEDGLEAAFLELDRMADRALERARDRRSSGGREGRGRRLFRPVTPALGVSGNGDGTRRSGSVGGFSPYSTDGSTPLGLRRRRRRSRLSASTSSDAVALDELTRIAALEEQEDQLGGGDVFEAQEGQGQMALDYADEAARAQSAPPVIPGGDPRRSPRAVGEVQQFLDLQAQRQRHFRDF